MHSDAVKSATILYQFFFMQWNLIHKSVIHIWKQNFRIYLDTLNINYVLRNSLVLIFFLPLLIFLSWSRSLFLSHPRSMSFCLSDCMQVCSSVCLPVSLSICLPVSLLFYPFLWSWYFVVKSKSKHFDWCKWMDASIYNV